ncbi:hypothetical protein CT676_09870 [Bradyrhizobium sp. MOS001]|uniref:hypothetical protein n=1 Tax=unclassified Bradyrhizobium TaxID=2631580 RepID=UPI001074C188|nr:hypothetical protein [Bradyrhizobium sp. MOS001]TFW61176.1 hypothetical protein CT676_09870 [Bradyrhizobium sp. MOS001]
MKSAVFPLAVTLNFACGIAYAQSANDPMDNLRTCSMVEEPARLKCLEIQSRKIASPAKSGPYDNWLLSETTSPVDYSPIVTATTRSRGDADDAAMQLVIHCRRGRSELVLTGATMPRSAEAYAISYRVNADPPVQLAAAASPLGYGAVFRGDVVGLLQSLPEEGSIVVRLSTRAGSTREGHFLLDGLKVVREKLATACKWPHPVSSPRH